VGAPVASFSVESGNLMEFERHSNGPLEPLKSELATGFFRAGHHQKGPGDHRKIKEAMTSPKAAPFARPFFCGLGHFSGFSAA
jgi:hypothetical protein